MKKAIVKTLLQLDALLRKGDVYIFSIHVMPNPNKYILYLYDEHFKYVCECHDLLSFDIRMIRKVYDNLYYYNDELEELAQIFNKTTENVNK